MTGSGSTTFAAGSAVTLTGGADRLGGGRTLGGAGTATLGGELVADSGGAFPIIIKNVGIIGTITVSGMPDSMDHAYVTDAIRECLGL